MKRRLSIALLALITVFSLACPGQVMADSRRVVTLGADLSNEQEKMMLKYFGIRDRSSVEILTITNDDEREHLSSFVPLEQIGTHTYSCAYVCPTRSGGIRVKTANLSWVTSNMIATTLSTSGIRNCDVIAASPFRVSGTGALTGVMMAYEEASGTVLDEDKKKLATEELIITGELAEEIGQVEAVEIVNEIKIQIIENEVVDDDEVEDIVDEVIEKYQSSNDQVPAVGERKEIDKEKLVELAKGIAAEDFEYEAVKDTLERVEENVKQEDAADTVTDAEPEEDEPSVSEQEEIAEDSILNDTNDSALGDDVISDSTDQEDNLPAPAAAEPEEDQDSAAAAEPEEQDSAAAAEPEKDQDSAAPAESEKDQDSAAPADQEESPEGDKSEAVMEAKGEILSSGAVEGILEILVEAENVVPVSGTVTITDTEEMEIDLSDSAKVIAAPAEAADPAADPTADPEASESTVGTRFLIITGRNEDMYFNEERSIHVDLVAENADGQQFHAVADQVFAAESFGVSLQLSDASELAVGEVVNCILYSEETEGTVAVKIDGEEQQVIDLAENTREFSLTVPETGKAVVEIIRFNAEGEQVQAAELELFAGN